MEKKNAEEAQEYSKLNPGSKSNNDTIENVVTNSTNEYLGTTTCIPQEVHEKKNALIASISRLQAYTNASVNQGATNAEVKNEEIEDEHPEDNANNESNNIGSQTIENIWNITDKEDIEEEVLQALHFQWKYMLAEFESNRDESDESNTYESDESNTDESNTDESPSKASSEERNNEIDNNASNHEEEILDELRNEKQPKIENEVEIDDHLYVVIDTNIWLHSFASITAILNRQYYILVDGKKYLAKIYIPRKTVQELDKMKKHKKIGFRARRAIRLILRLLLNRDERISFQTKKMYRKVFDPLDDPDDLIIQACVQLKDMNKHVRLYSNDNCCKQKALMEGIDIIEFN